MLLRLTTVEKVPDHGDRAKDGTADATGQPDNVTLTVADRTNAMQCPLDARSVVGTKLSEAIDNSLKIMAFEGRRIQGNSPTRISRFRNPAKVENDLKQLITALRLGERLPDRSRQKLDETIQVVSDPLCGHG